MRLWASCCSRIHANSRQRRGAAYTDSASNLWSADTGFNTGQASHVRRALLRGQVIRRCTERSDGMLSRPQSSCTPLPYRTAHTKCDCILRKTHPGAFAAGARVFDVTVEGATVPANLDVYAQAAANAALVKTTIVTVTDGVLNIGFVHGTGESIRECNRDQRIHGRRAAERPHGERVFAESNQPELGRALLRKRRHLRCGTPPRYRLYELLALLSAHWGLLSPIAGSSRQPPIVTASGRMTGRANIARTRRSSPPPRPRQVRARSCG